MKSFKRVLASTIIAICFVAPTLTRADEESGTVMVSNTITATATVVEIDQSARTFTLQDEDGNEYSLVAGDEIRNFSQIRKGDVLVVKYQRAAASDLEKVDNLNVANASAEVQRAPAGAKPGLAMNTASTIVAEVMAIDKAQRLLTVQGPKGGIVTIEVPKDVKAFDALEVGDMISAVYTEALAISVTTPKK